MAGPRRWPKAAHVFVDESERHRTYYLCAVIADPAKLVTTRRRLRELLRPGMRRLHMVKEGDSLRHKILTTLVDVEVQARVYVCQGRQAEVRPACLRQCILDAVAARAHRLVIDDLTEARHDRQLIAEVLRDTGKTLDYDHLRSYADPLLWAADGIAWAFGAAGGWRREVAGLLDDVVKIQH
jgi:hypothetical protein